MELTDIDRQKDAEALAKVATDRRKIIESKGDCEHTEIVYVGQTQMRICNDCRRYMTGSDVFQARRDSWMK